MKTFYTAFKKKEKRKKVGVREFLCFPHWKYTIMREEMPLQLTDLQQ